MKKNLILLLLLFTVACNTIDKKDLTVIDGISLGVTEDQFTEQVLSLNLGLSSFYTKKYMTEQDLYEDYRILFSYTKLFDNSKYGGNNINHLGLIQRIVFAGTENVVGLNVLLGHTEIAYDETRSGLVNLTKKVGFHYFEQCLTDAQVYDIENMLIAKYGKPKNTFKSEYSTVYLLKNNNIKAYSNDTSNMGEIVIWETKYLDIKLFKGIPSPNFVYSIKDRSYIYYFESNPLRDIDYDKGERHCMQYAYISYQLKNKTIKKLKLDINKL